MTDTASFVGMALISFLSLSIALGFDYKGVCYDADWENRSAWYGTEEAERQLKRLKRMGVNAISVTPFAFQKEATSPLISFREKLDPGLEKDIQMAKKGGMRVVFKPHIWSDQFWDGSGHWHGSIEMQDEEEWTEWFRAYQKMLSHFARQAERLRVDLFVIGIEYVKATQKREKAWEDIIASVRAIYKGPLTYAAHGLEEAEQIQFWDQLDYIGVNAYFPLTDQLNPTLSELKESWKNNRAALASLSKKNNKAVLLTEVGYSSADGTAQKPYLWPAAGTPIDEHEQAQCYEALFSALKHQGWLKGLFIWKFKIGVTPIEKSREPSEAYFVFQDKPAEKIIKEYFID